MKIWLKRILISLVVVLIVALVGIAIFLLTFDPNAYKSRVEQIVYERYHRTLEINGDIELSLFPRIGLAVQDVSLSNRDSEDTFASIDSARFAVAIWPLLFNRLVVDHVAVTGFKAWLVRETDGRFNFRDLVYDEHSAPLQQGVTSAVASDTGRLERDMASSASERGGWPGASGVAEPSHGAILGVVSSVIATSVVDVDKADFQIDIAGLDLKGGEIHFLDRKTGSVGRVVQLDVNTGRMTFDQAFDVSLRGKLIGDKPSADAQLEGQALVQLNPLTRTYSAQRVNLLMNGELGELDAKSVALKGNLAYSEYSRMFSASSLELHLQGELKTEPPVTNLDANLSVPQLRIDRSEAEFQVTRLALRVKGRRDDEDLDIALDAPSLSISPETAKGEPVSGTFKSTGTDEVLGVSLQMAGLGGDAFNLTLQELKFDSAHKQGDRAVSIQMSSPASWSPFGRRGGLSAMKGDVRIEDETLPGGRFQFPFIGSMQADLYKDEFNSAINAVFGGNKIDFSLAATQLHDPHVVFDLSTDSVDLNTLFPPPAPPEPEPSEEQADDAPVEQPEQTEPAPPAPPVRQFDWTFLDSAHVQGTVQINALKAGGFDLSAIQALVSAQDGVLNVSDIKADLYGGSLESNVSVSSQHDVTLNLAATNVDLRPLSQALTGQPRILGQADFEILLATHGTTTPALTSGLSGTIQGQARNGAWVGLNLSQTLVEANEVLRNAFSGQLPHIASRFDASRRTEFDQLDVELALQQGQGQVRQLRLTSPLLQVTEGEPASLDLVNRQLDVVVQVTGQTQGQSAPVNFSVLDGVTVPVRVSGPFKALSYQIQWQDISDSVVKDAIQGGLLDILSHLSEEGGSSFLFPPEEKTDAVKRDPLKSIGDVLKGLLGQ